ncbi:hypothetical protein DTO271D3_618 [Paecilomyces variotii]|nr:hypothetical protein DTO169C6_4701 [Paecilomyces variotii]KAJ9235773.1 hypothetical protein DTO169E5_5936 [Paecilomyces variotii]KAJ9319030.1 hypothetical protein DTO271D3_618 [Paecilomyces variotii]
MIDCRPNLDQVYSGSICVSLTRYQSRERTATMPLFARIITLTNFVIASSALSFQIFVLEPWHQTLDDQFQALKTEHIAMLKRHGEELSAIRSQIEALKEKEAKRGKWF